ncbi:hypothetical protein [Gorillibacterium sp. sgz5001074]|uniref:hypothetical protein n=1 Tax=Gorillibacterium sp. sgz5001074 TaxID=3446695 RepID=UPI003F67F8D4
MHTLLRRTGKTAPYLIVYLLLVHLLVPMAVPFREVYHNRLDYNILLNRHGSIGQALDQLSREIKRRRLEHYVIILGDSVFYGSPGGSEQSMNAFIEKDWPGYGTGEPPAIFNLSLPAVQVGDMYALTLMLKERHISTEHLILNLRYGSFVERPYWTKPLFWWMGELKRLDPVTYRSMPYKESEELKDHTPPFHPSALGKGIRDWFRDELWFRYNLVAYKDYLTKGIGREWRRLNRKEDPSDALAIPVAWYEKDYGNLTEYLASEEIRFAFNDKPFELGAKSPDVFFLEKIVRRSPNADTLVVLSGINRELMKDYVSKPGFIANSERLNAYLSGLPSRFLNVDGLLPDRLYTDHTHLMPEGYRELARLVWQAYSAKEGTPP